MTEPPRPAETPLEGWKAIAAYLSRDTRTAKRWEMAEALPVHRHRHLARSSVYAYPSELDAWRANRRPEPRVKPESTSWLKKHRHALILAPALTAALFTVGGGRAVGPMRIATLTAAQNDAETVRRRVGVGQAHMSAVSFDGRYMAFGDSELSLRDMLSGETRRLTAGSGAAGAAVSRDGRQVAYRWWNRADSRYELRVQPIEPGASHRVLHASSEAVQFVMPYDWSPDGRLILAQVMNADRTSQLAVLGVEDGSLRVIKSLSWMNPWRPSFSPDGRYIAYNVPPNGDTVARDVYLLAADGGSEAPLARTPADEFLLGWTPDGGSVVFASDRTGTVDVWTMAVANGRAAGDPVRVARNLGPINPLGISRDGALYYHVSGHRELYTRRLNPSTFEAIGMPRVVTDRMAGQNAGPSWSPDGRQFAYASQREVKGETRPVILIRSDSSERELLPALRYVTGYSGLKWFPDGRSLLAPGADEQGREGLFRIDVRTGDASRVGPSAAPHPEISRDGGTIYYVPRAAAGQRPSIRARLIESGDEREVFGGPVGYGQLALSPDGRLLAFGFLTHLMVVPVDGGRARELLRNATGENLYPPTALLWSHDGRHVIFGKSRAGGTPQQETSLWAIPAEGGEARPLGVSGRNLLGVRLHPAGTAVAYLSDEQASEVWVMENFLGAARQ